MGRGRGAEVGLGDGGDSGPLVAGEGGHQTPHDRLVVLGHPSFGVVIDPGGRALSAGDRGGAVHQ